MVWKPWFKRGHPEKMSRERKRVSEGAEVKSQRGGMKRREWCHHHQGVGTPVLKGEYWLLKLEEVELRRWNPNCGKMLKQNNIPRTSWRQILPCDMDPAHPSSWPHHCCYLCSSSQLTLSTAFCLCFCSSLLLGSYFPRSSCGHWFTFQMQTLQRLPPWPPNPASLPGPTPLTTWHSPLPKMIFRCVMQFLPFTLKC